MSEKMILQLWPLHCLIIEKYEINRRYVTILEPKFKIKHVRMKKHKQRYTIGKKNWKMAQM